MLIVLRENQLTLQVVINKTPNELKSSGIVAIDSCFALFGARQYGATSRENSDPELSTPTESHHTTCLLGGKSPI